MFQQKTRFLHPEERATFYQADFASLYTEAQAILDAVMSNETLKGTETEDLAQQVLGALSSFSTVYPSASSY
jgi:hypothetical protein